MAGLTRCRKKGLLREITEIIGIEFSQGNS